MLILPHNRNETPEHYELKQIAKLLLWKRGYHYIGTEVGGFYNYDPKLPRKMYHKNVIDVVGAETCNWRNGNVSKIRMMGFEAKVSKSDFRNGYCTACENTYIIAPKGIIPVEELVDGIGLVEVDLQNYKIGKWGTEIWTDGIKVPVKAKSRLAARFDTKEDRQKWAVEQFKRIAYRASSECLWKQSSIQILTERKHFNPNEDLGDKW